MKYSKQVVIDGLKRTIEQNEEKIIDIRSRAIHARDVLERWSVIC